MTEEIALYSSVLMNKQYKSNSSTKETDEAKNSENIDIFSEYKSKLASNPILQSKFEALFKNSQKTTNKKIYESYYNRLLDEEAEKKAEISRLKAKVAQTQQEVKTAKEQYAKAKEEARKEKIKDEGYLSNKGIKYLAHDIMKKTLKQLSPNDYRKMEAADNKSESARWAEFDALSAQNIAQSSLAFAEKNCDCVSTMIGIFS